MDDDDDLEDPSALTTSDRLSKLRMASLVRQYLQAQNLEVLVEGGLEDAVMRFVDKDDKDAIKEWVLYLNFENEAVRLTCSFVHDTLRTVGKDMKSREVGEQDVEEHVSCRSIEVTCASQ